MSVLCTSYSGMLRKMRTIVLNVSNSRPRTISATSRFDQPDHLEHSQAKCGIIPSIAAVATVGSSSQHEFQISTWLETSLSLSIIRCIDAEIAPDSPSPRTHLCSCIGPLCRRYRANFQACDRCRG